MFTSPRRPGLSHPLYGVSTNSHYIHTALDRTDTNDAHVFTSNSDNTRNTATSSTVADNTSVHRLPTIHLLATSDTNLVLVKETLNSQLLINQVDMLGETPLLKASLHGAFSVAQFLVACGADIAHADLAGWTALHNASSRGHLEIVAMLLAAGADPNAANKNGFTPSSTRSDLVCACAHGNLSIFNALKQAGASIGPINDDGDACGDIAITNEWYHLARTIGHAGYFALYRANIHASDLGKPRKTGLSPAIVCSCNDRPLFL